MQPFVIPVNGLTQGSTRFDWRADGAFFDSFDQSEIRSADLSVSVRVEKSGRYTGVDGTVEGTVTVLCDRCMEELVLPVRTEFLLSVKYGEEAGDADAGDREIVMLPEGEADLDLSQIVYDYVNISLPLRRVHPEGGCNPQTLKYLGDQNETAQPAGDNPFAALKDLLNDNNNVKR